MTTPTTFADLVNGIIFLINIIIPTIIGIVFLVLTFKMFDAWIVNSADEKKREEGKQIALTSVVVMVILLSVWGIVIMLQKSFFG